MKICYEATVVNEQGKELETVASIQDLFHEDTQRSGDIGSWSYRLCDPDATVAGESGDWLPEVS